MRKFTEGDKVKINSDIELDNITHEKLKLKGHTGKISKYILSDCYLVELDKPINAHGFGKCSVIVPEHQLSNISGVVELTKGEYMDLAMLIGNYRAINALAETIESMAKEDDLTFVRLITLIDNTRQIFTEEINNFLEEYNLEEIDLGNIDIIE